MKQVTLMDLLDSSIFNTNSLAPTLYLSESDENYLNRENKDKVFSLVKMSEKKKQLKLSSLFKIFSKRKIYDTSYVFEKVVEWCRSKLQFVGENDNRDVIFSTELKNAISVIVYVLLTCVKIAFFLSASTLACLSCFNFVNNSIPKSGLFSISSITLSVAYIPFLRIDGIISSATNA